MKITKSQKEAVIDLLKEKLNDKEVSEKEKFIKKNQKAINSELEKIHELAKEYTQLANRMYEICNSVKNLNFHNDAMFSYEEIKRYDYTKKQYISEGIKIYTKDPCVKFHIEFPDFNKVERELELASLGKDFDVEKFLKKYLEK